MFRTFPFVPRKRVKFDPDETVEFSEFGSGKGVDGRILERIYKFGFKNPLGLAMIHNTICGGFWSIKKGKGTEIGSEMISESIQKLFIADFSAMMYLEPRR
ncbi:hypothetical protein [uncultured Desulfosarcina sp.]|uniref:hypothetical protein n=1 Tax=uncultured Desulfosarcina sp. TaxID=218289 RepID=UPI0029C97784|nr:hypothetical protein [uncultured Desulfosarcina sp.]